MSIQPANHPLEFKQKLAAEWCAGLSASEIAARHGISRNVIVGLAYRNRDLFPQKAKGRKDIIGISRAHAPVKKASTRMFDRPRQKPVKIACRVKDRLPPEPKVKPQPDRIVDAAAMPKLDGLMIAGQEPVTFLDRNRRQCAFPVSASTDRQGASMLCCGAEVSKPLAPYCRHHHRIAYSGWARAI